MLRLSNINSLQLFQLTRYASFILIGICFAKLRIPQSEIAQFETFILVSGMVSFFWVSGIINSMLSIYPKKNEEEKKAVLFNTFITLFGFSLIAGFTLSILGHNIFHFLNKGEDRGLIELAILFLIFNNPSFLIEYILFLKEKKKAIVIYGVITALASVLVAAVPVLLQWRGYETLQYAMQGLIFIALIRLCITVVLLYKYAAFKFDIPLLVQHLKISTPVIFSIFVSGSAEYIDGVIVKSKFNDVFFTVYRYGAKELPVLLILANTFSTGMIAPIAANLQEGLKELKERSAKLMHLLFPLTIILMLASPYLYRFVFSSSFAYSALIFNLYLLLIIPRLVFPQTILTGLQHTRYLLISSIIEIIINVSLSIYLAGKLGLYGVAVGTFVAYCIDKLFLMGVAYFVYNIAPSRYIKVMPYLVYVTLTIVTFVLGYVFMAEL